MANWKWIRSKRRRKFRSAAQKAGRKRCQMSHFSFLSEAAIGVQPDSDMIARMVTECFDAIVLNSVVCPDQILGATETDRGPRRCPRPCRTSNMPRRRMPRIRRHGHAGMSSCQIVLVNMGSIIYFWLERYVTVLQYTPYTVAGVVVSSAS